MIHSYSSAGRDTPFGAFEVFDLLIVVQLLDIVRFLDGSFQSSQILNGLPDTCLQHLIVRVQVLILNGLEEEFIEKILRRTRQDADVEVTVNIEKHGNFIRVHKFEVVCI